MKYLYSPPFLVKKMFSSFQWDSNIPKVLLTFDDGPEPEVTELILKELDDKKIKSIFFCVGENLEKYPSLAKQILAEGHEIGNHTTQHRRIQKLKRDDILQSINNVQQIAEEKLDYKIKYFRPPYGNFDLRTSGIMKETKLQNVMWSLVTYDYKNDLNIVKFATSKYLRKNSIVVLHDNIKSKSIIKDSIQFVLEEAQKKNYEIGKPSECLK